MKMIQCTKNDGTPIGINPEAVATIEPVTRHRDGKPHDPPLVYISFLGEPDGLFLTGRFEDVFAALTWEAP